MNINKSEILRYLGYGKNLADENVMNIIDVCIYELMNASSMRSVHGIFDISINCNTIDFGGFKVESSNLSKNLYGCSQAILFAATLGSKTDFILNKCSKTDMGKAVIMEACAVEIIEKYCDECQQNIELDMSENHIYLRPRFSPGYGDFNINYQKDMMSMLDLPRKAGITLTDGYMLAPSKSVTAVIGLSTTKQNCHKKGCEECSKLDCQFRRS